jgi:ABC-type transport system involved in multi-copper enzyme maturation permease subunit
MPASPALPRLRKEARVLMPAALGCAVVVALSAMRGGGFAGVGAYALAGVMLGALSMGAEYSTRTLGMFLAQPVARERLYLEKQLVLAATLAALTTLTWFTVIGRLPAPAGYEAWRSGWLPLTIAVVPALFGFCVAPLLTMVSRSVLGGTVFSIGVALLVWLASQYGATHVYGADLSTTPAAAELALDMFWRSSAALAVLAMVAGWWMFVRLEALDARGIALALPSRANQTDTANPAVSVRQSAYVLLARKEARLQVPAVAVAALYVVAWFGVVWLSPWPPHLRANFLAILTMFHVGAVALLAGAVASAEEREMGTLAWQVLLPMAAWKQWLVKIGIGSAVALILAVGVPRLLQATLPSDVRQLVYVPRLVPLAYVVVGLFAIALYASSLSTSALRALVYALPAVAVVAATAGRWSQAANFGLMSAPWTLLAPARGLQPRLAPEYARWFAPMFGVSIVLLAGPIALLITFALANHRSAERPGWRTVRQLAVLVAFVVTCSMAWTLLRNGWLSALRANYFR